MCRQVKEQGGKGQAKGRGIRGPEREAGEVENAEDECEEGLAVGVWAKSGSRYEEMSDCEVNSGFGGGGGLL